MSSPCSALTNGLGPKVVASIVEALNCPICLEVAQIPVNIICFQGCGGTHSFGNTCLRSLVCQHCANQALELDKPPPVRFPKTSGITRCIICRDTRIDARLLAPELAYQINYNLMEVMDLLGLPSSCRQCNLDMANQMQVQQHYLKQCPHAVVPCRFKNCGHYAVRSLLHAHEEVCPVGRARCSQCLMHLDKSDLLTHMVTTCKNRIVSCLICSHRARLPEMLQHLKLHQAQLQTEILRKERASHSGAATTPAVSGGGSGGSGGSTDDRGFSCMLGSSRAGRTQQGGTGVSELAAAAAALLGGMPMGQQAMSGEAGAVAAVGAGTSSGEAAATNPALAQANSGTVDMGSGASTVQAAPALAAAGAATDGNRSNGSSDDGDGSRSGQQGQERERSQTSPQVQLFAAHTSQLLTAYRSSPGHVRPDSQPSPSSRDGAVSPTDGAANSTAGAQSPWLAHSPGVAATGGANTLQGIMEADASASVFAAEAMATPLPADTEPTADTESAAGNVPAAPAPLPDHQSSGNGASSGRTSRSNSGCSIAVVKFSSCELPARGVQTGVKLMSRFAKPVDALPLMGRQAAARAPDTVRTRRQLRRSFSDTQALRVALMEIERAREALAHQGSLPAELNPPNARASQPGTGSILH